MGVFTQSGSVKSGSQSNLDALAQLVAVGETKLPDIVDLGLEERGLVQGPFRADFHDNVAAALVTTVPHSLSGDLHLSVQAVVIDCGKGSQGVESELMRVKRANGMVNR